MSLEKIFAKYPQEIAAVLAGQDLGNFDSLYNDLFEHYVCTQEMPYGIAKARTGDPYIWLTEKLQEAAW